LFALKDMSGSQHLADGNDRTVPQGH
jgi:hypothetical protein